MIIANRKTNGPASVGALPDRGSINPTKDMKMNSMDNTTAAPAAASPFRHLPGANERENVSYEIANLSSLFTVCALALNDAENWSDEVRTRVTQDIKHVLEYGALLAVDAGELAERQLGALR